MRKAILCIGVLAVCLLVLPSSVKADINIFMHIDRIPGESQAADHENWIDVLAFSEGFSNTGIADDSATNRIVITKYLDKSSPPLRMKRYGGRELANLVTIDMATSGVDPIVIIMKIELGSVTVESITTEVDALGSPRPMENIALRFKYIRITYTPVDVSGLPLPAIIREYTFP